MTYPDTVQHRDGLTGRAVTVERITAEAARKYAGRSDIGELGIVRRHNGSLALVTVPGPGTLRPDVIESLAGAIADDEGATYVPAILHDTHAIDDDELERLEDNPGAACYHAFIDLYPQRGEVFTDLTGQAFVVFEGDTGPHLFSLATGSRFQFAAVTSIGPLTRAQIVPADAIVLEQPRLTDTIDLSAAVGGGKGNNTPPVAVLIEGDVRRVVLLTGCQACSNPTLTSEQARTMAAHTALAAAEVEAGTL